ncbi:DUF192 domain-containing protein [Halomicrobium salinisoli]|uniref:DUF192 domain-containing protein n=1 Tax=Halomicrobium salinisoli TaxID=2878391 RepID=UPI001CF00E64|nr:DUF192 domain-containing protein [Halomicrobium salinisoli]
MQRARSLAVVGLVLLVALAGCAQFDAGSTTATSTDAPTETATPTAEPTPTATPTPEPTPTIDLDRGNATGTFLTDDGNVTVTLEVADEPTERSEGLMNRTHLPERHGMVFVYDGAAQRGFWMKNTLIPLDMIFIAPNGTVLNVEHARTQPNASVGELETYYSDGHAQYVVEMERGFANETGVGPGTQVELDLPESNESDAE